MGVDPDQVTILNDWWPHVDCGDPTNFIELFDWMLTADLYDPQSYAYVASKIDLSNFIDYYIFELFSENTDWPANNMRCWQIGDGKWRWIFFDGDACFCWGTFNAFANALYEGDDTWPSSWRASLFFRKLSVNEDFCQQFNNRFQELLTTTISYSNTGMLFEEIKEVLAPEIPFQSQRFGYPVDIDTWNTYLGHTQWFLMKRCEYILPVLKDFLQGTVWSKPENQQTLFKVFPNPFLETVTLHIEAELYGTTTCSVYDIMGRQVFVQNLSLNAGPNIVLLDLPLSSGMYFLKIGTQIVKIVKQ